VTFVSVPDSITLPPQPEQIMIEAVEMPLADPLLGMISINSPHILLINERVIAKIRKQYSINDEIKMLRVGPSPETETYNDYVEECRAWGRAEKERLLGPPIKSNTESWLASKDALLERVKTSYSAFSPTE